jgi:hypothetical protein
MHPNGSVASKNAEYLKAFRARARAMGLCTVCGKRKARPKRVTCKKCSDAAAERMKARRAETLSG